MASTNKTTHYELSQYVASDKPTYLTDYNNDMSAIDTGIYNAQDKADSAYTLANTADGKADTGITNAGIAQTDASSALTRIGTLTNLTTTEKTNLVGAVNEVNYNVGNFNLTNYTSYSDSDITNGNGTMYVATNADGSLAKIYGTITTAGYPSIGTAKISTSLRPSSDITIVGGCIGQSLAGTTIQSIGSTSYTIKTNGDIELGFAWYDGTTTSNKYIFVNSLIFVKDFGDSPIPPQS